MSKVLLLVLHLGGFKCYLNLSSESGLFIP